MHLCPETLGLSAKVCDSSHISPHIPHGLAWDSYGNAVIYERVDYSSDAQRYVTTDGDSSVIATDADGVPATRSIT